MKRFSSIRNLVLSLLGALALGGCFAQAPGPDDLSQTDDGSRHSQLVGVENGGTVASHSQSQSGLAISGSTPLGGTQMGPQPEPWTGAADGDPNGGPQPEPWKPHKIAPEPTPSAAAPKP